MDNKLYNSIKKFVDTKIAFLDPRDLKVLLNVDDSNNLVISSGIKKYIDDKAYKFEHIRYIDLHEFYKKIDNYDKVTELPKDIKDKLYNTDPNIRYRALPNTSSALYGMKNLKELKINVDMSNVTDMRYMFKDCSNLISLDLSKWNTDNVTDMSSMFSSCSSLTSLDVSKFDTKNVTDMGFMFNNCSKLTSLDLSKFNTKNINNMYSMFSVCSSLTSLDISNFDTKNVTDMHNMFNQCSKLTSLDVSKWDTKNVTSMTDMFRDCSSLANLDISNFNTKNVTDMSGIFYDCSSLKYIILEDISDNNKKLLDKIIELHNKYSKVKLLTTKENYEKYKDKYTFLDDMNNYNISRHDGMVEVKTPIKIIDIDLHEFYEKIDNYDKITELPKDVQDKLWNTNDEIMYRALPNARYSFGSLMYSMKNLKELKINVDMSNVTDMGYMFYGCSSLTSLDVSHFDTKNVTNMTGMFWSCSSLTSLDVSKWNNTSVFTMEWMFHDCSKLASLDLSKWNTENINNMYSVFRNCSKLTSLDVSKWNTKNVSDMTDIFYDCSSLTYIILEDISDNNKKLLDKIVELHNKYKKVKVLTTKENYDRYKSTYSFLDDMNNYNISRHNGEVNVYKKGGK